MFPCTKRKRERERGREIETEIENRRCMKVSRVFCEGSPTWYRSAKTITTLGGALTPLSFCDEEVGAIRKTRSWLLPRSQTLALDFVVGDDAEDT